MEKINQNFETGSFGSAKGNLGDEILAIIESSIAPNNGFIIDVELDINPKYQKPSPVNKVLLGLPSTGKTCCLHQTLKKIISDNIAIPIEIDCVKNNTSYAVITSILTELSETGLPYKSQSLDVLCKELGELVVSKRNHILLILDNLNQMQSYEDINEIYSQLILLNQDIPNFNINIYALINDIHFNLREVLDDSINTQFEYVTVDFPPYTEDEMFSILNNIAEEGFYPGVITEQQIRNVSAVAYLFSNLEVGRYLLKKCAERSQDAGKDRIEDSDIQEAIAEFKLVQQYPLFNALSSYNPVAPSKNSKVPKKQHATQHSDLPGHDESIRPDIQTVESMYQKITNGNERVMSQAEYCDILSHLQSLQVLDTRINRMPDGHEYIEITSDLSPKKLLKTIKKTYGKLSK